MADAHKNFAYSSVLTAPSPRDSGTSLVVQSGDGTKFPAVSFNATVCPPNQLPTSSNSEIVRVTAISTDTFTITRAQESTTAKPIDVGWIIDASITAKALTDAEPTKTVDANGWTVYKYGNAWTEYEKVLTDSAFSVANGENDLSLFTTTQPVGITPSNNEADIILRRLWANTAWNNIWKGWGTSVSGSTLTVNAHFGNTFGSTVTVDVAITLRLRR